MLIFGAKIQIYIWNTYSSPLRSQSCQMRHFDLFLKTVHICFLLLHLPDANISRVIKMTMNWWWSNSLLRSSHLLHTQSRLVRVKDREFISASFKSPSFKRTKWDYIVIIFNKNKEIVNQHSVWKSPKKFCILAFFTNFCPIKVDLSGNTVWPQASGFQKLAKMDHFWHF